MNNKYYILIDTPKVDKVKRLGPFLTLAQAFGMQLKYPNSLLVKEVKTKIVEELS